MGHNKRQRPKRGAKQFWPRVRAKRMYPRIRSWQKHSQTKLLGFAGYKAGMTHIHFVDNRANSPTKGEEIRMPVTVLETPSIHILSVRLYQKSGYGLSLISEAWADTLTQDLKRRLKLPKKRSNKLQELEKQLEKAAEVRVLIYTQPKYTGFGKKKPDVFELGIGGSDPKAKFDFAKSILGTDVPLSQVFKEGEILDVHAITKGKGFQGVVKRFGVKIQPRKAETRRKIGTLGPWTPKNVPYWVPMAGQMGFHPRTEYNKHLLKIANAKDQEVTPNGGFVRYGQVKGDYILVAGSVPGPKKRLITLTHATRAYKTIPAPENVEISRRSQQ